MVRQAIKIPKIQDEDMNFPKVMQRLLLKPNFTVGSLFAGMGGIDMGFKNAGFFIKWANEIDEKACVTYKNNHDNEIICQDIQEFKIGKTHYVDILTAGFPCQPFSVAGYRKGFADERGNIFFEILRFIKTIQPKVILLENVKNLINHNKKQTFEHILESIKKAGYNIHYQVLNACEYSEIPQNRERVYIVCFKSKTCFDKFIFPNPIKKTRSLPSMLDKNVDNKYYYNKTKYYDILKKEMTNKNTCYQWRRQYVRENKSNLCPTLTANMGTGGHNVPLIKDDKDIRKLTPRECARLQGFSNDFKFPKELANSTLYKQIGNSVSVPVIQSIAENIMIALGYGR